MGSRITVYYVRKSDYKRNIGKMNDDKLEEVLDRSKKALKLDRKGLSTIAAKGLEISAGSGKKVSIATGNKFRSAITKGLHLAVKDYAGQNSLSMPDIHTLTGAGLLIETFKLVPGNKLYGGYFVIYA
jgi:hypothetical protein